MGIKRIILSAFGSVYKHRKPFAKALLIPVSILVVLGVNPVQDPGLPLTVLFILLSMLIYAVIAITTHRIILLGPESVAEWGVYLPSKREYNFILYSIGFVLLMIPFAFFALIQTVGVVVGVLAIVYMMARLSLVFPAIATDHGWSFLDSWKATRNHQILMVLVVGIFPLVISIPEQLLSNVPYAGVFVNLLSALTMVFTVAALSVAFQLIAENDQENL